MTDRFQRTHPRLDELREAARLTGLGRLEEATALIQRNLRGTAPAPARDEPPTLDLTAERVEDVPRRGSQGHHDGLQTLLDPERVRAAVDKAVRGLSHGVAPLLKGLEDLAGGGRSPAPSPGESAFVERSFASAAGTRDYKLFLPSRPQQPAPLVIMLHGCSQSPDDFAAGTGMNALAERDGLFVAYPAQSRIANGQRCWNWFEPRDQGREAGEVAIVAGLTREIMEEFPIDPARVYIAGLSAGGAAAANVARAYPDLYAAVGVHSGLAAGCARDLSSALMAMQVGAPGSTAPNGFGAPAVGPRMPTIVFHGEDDGTVNARNADQVLAQAGVHDLTAERESLNEAGRPATRTRYRDRAGRVLVEDWRVRGGGHAWFGGDPRGSYTDAQGPDASEAMLDFFARHRLAPREG